MGNTVTIYKNGLMEQFEDVLGHQVGYSHVQVLLRDGTQRIISNFDDIDIILDDEGREKFKSDLERQEVMAEAQAAAQEAAEQAKVPETDGSPQLVAVNETEH